MQEDSSNTTQPVAEDPFSWGYWRTLYPFEGHRLKVAGGAIMNYVDEGEGDPILMVHGNPTWSFYYRRLILALRRTHRCVAPDHIGCGLSEKPQDYRYRLDRHIENLEQLIEELDLSGITLVCHDWGGAIGMGMAERHRHRIKRLVILNTAAFPSSRIPLRINVCRLPLFGALAIRGLNLFARAAIHMAVVEPGRMTPNTVQGYLRPYNNWSNRVAVLRFVQDIPMNPRHPTYELIKKIGEGLGAFSDTPVLICWGGRDFCFNDTFLEEWRRRFPQAEVHRFPEAGHYVLEDAHEEIIPLVKSFLERN